MRVAQKWGILLILLSMTSCDLAFLHRAEQTSELPKVDVTKAVPSPTLVSTPSPTPVQVEEPVAIEDEAQEPILGVLGKILPRVTYRRSSELTWNEAEEELPLHEQDAVQTHEKAKAHIKLNNGSELSLGEETLVIITPSLAIRGKSKDRAIVKKGKLVTRTKTELWLQTSAALFRIKSKNSKKEAKALISIQEGKKLSVELKSGEGEVLQKIVTKKGEILKSKPIALEQPLVLTLPKKEIEEWSEKSIEKAIEKREVAAIPPKKDIKTSVVIESPVNYSEILEDKVRVAGKSNTPDAQILVNGKMVKLDKDLRFGTFVPLEVGANSIVIQLVLPNKESVFKRWVVIRKEP